MKDMFDRVFPPKSWGNRHVKCHFESKQGYLLSIWKKSIIVQDQKHYTFKTKSFGRKQTVKNLKFHLENNKCFGLLGVNGAGKSTTFRMLTKHLFFDKGQIAISEGLKSTSISKAEVRNT
jgi:ABC-type uncharacterized transport system ATPase subunit